MVAVIMYIENSNPSHNLTEGSTGLKLQLMLANSIDKVEYEQGFIDLRVSYFVFILLWG